MLLVIDHHSGVPIYRQIMDQVREQIMAGLIKEGEQVMTVRELAASLNVNPMTVSKAYSAMEMEGLLERRRGIGLFVAAIRYPEKEKAKEAALEALLTKAVTMAVQFDISEKETQRMLGNSFAKYKSEERRKGNE